MVETRVTPRRIPSNTNRRFVPRLLTAAVLASLLVSCGRSASPDRNVVLITLDTVRADRIGCYGYTRARTPVLDDLASRGVLFTHAVASAPLTLPSHATMLTGLYPPSHGVRHNAIYRLPDGIPTLAERLKDAGFATGAVLGSMVLNRDYGLARGFDHYDDIPTTAMTPGSITYDASERSAETVTRRALSWLDGVGGRRFFLWAHYFDCHWPYVRRGASDGSTSALYDGELAYVDAAVGELLRGVRELTGDDRTVVVIVGDHGEALEDHGESSHGYFVYDEVMRVPMIVRAPRGRAGVAVDGQAATADVAPTILGLLGLPPLDGAHGMDLSGAVLTEETIPEDRRVYLESELPRIEFGWSALKAIRSTRWKFIGAPEPELYDLSEDPGERHNLYPGPPSEDLSRELSSVLADLRVFDGDATRPLSPGELERLQSLGYLQGGAPTPGGEEGAAALLRDPKDALDLFRRITAAELLQSDGRHEEAVVALREIASEEPGNRMVREDLVLALTATGELDEAEREALTGLELLSGSDLPYETSIRLRSFLAFIYDRQGRADDAARVLGEILDRDPDNREILSYMMFVELGRGRGSQALALARRLVQLGPSDSGARSEAVRLAVAARDPAAALELGVPLIESGGDPGALVTVGDLLRNAKRLQEAERAYRMALKEDGGRLGALWGLGRILMQTGRTAEGMETFERATAADPGHPTAWYNLGLAALMLDRESVAREALGKTLELKPDYVEAHTTLASFLAQRDRLDEACSEYRKALDVAPGNPEIRSRFVDICEPGAR